MSSSAVSWPEKNKTIYHSALWKLEQRSKTSRRHEEIKACTKSLPSCSSPGRRSKKWGMKLGPFASSREQMWAGVPQLAVAHFGVVPLNQVRAHTLTPVSLSHGVCPSWGDQGCRGVGGRTLDWCGTSGVTSQLFHPPLWIPLCVIWQGVLDTVRWTQVLEPESSVFKCQLCLDFQCLMQVAYLWRQGLHLIHPCGPSTQETIGTPCWMNESL